MKEGIRNAYRSFGYEFADYMDWRPQLRGNSKRKQKRVFTKGARQAAKISLRNEMNY